MKYLYRVLLLLTVACFCLPAHAHHLAVVVHQDNHTPAITSSDLGKIFKGEMRHWADGHNVIVVINKDSAVSMQVMERLSSMPRSEILAFFEAHKASFVLAASDADVLRIVQGTPGALGMVDVRLVTGKINVVKVDGKLPLEQGYLPH